MASSIDTRRRVKHYVLNDSRQWIDQGTGHVSWHYNKRAVSLVVKSETDGSTLLDSKIQLTIVYQRQQDTLIVWSDPSRRDQALSFQEKAGCDEVWEKICEVLGEDASLDTTSSRNSGEANNGGGGVTSSSGGGGGGGGSRGSSLQEIEGEEEREEETDNNLSPGDELPPCELARLKDIRDYFTCEVPRRSKRYKDRLSAVIESDSYINRLIDMFHTCEDLENEDGLHYLYEIFRCLFYLNKSSLLDILLNEEFIMDVIGCLEYDPNKPEPIRHREYITSKSRFKEIISFENSELVNRIHQTYKVQYIQDVILPAPSVFENSLTALTSYIFLNKVEISNLIQEDERFLNELFENLRNLQANSEKHQEMLEFLREYTGILHGLQQARDPFFKSLFDHGLLDVIELGLSLGDDKMSQTCIDILSHFVEVSPASVREYILKEIEAKSSVSNLNMSLKPETSSSSNSNSSSNNNSNSSNHINVTITSSKFPTTTPIVSAATTDSSSSSNIEVSTTTNNNNIDEQENKSSIDITEQQEEQQQHQRKETSDHDDINESVAMLSLSDILNTDDVFEPILINYVIKQMFNDTDPELGGALQIVNLLKLLIDPENMLAVANKSEKTEFLAYFYRKSMGILIAPLLANTSGGHIHREDFLVAQLQNLILDFLSFCVEHHTNHIKSYMVNKDLLKQILVLLKSRHQFLALSALRFLRKTISLKEEIYNKYIVKSNLLEPVVEALKTNASRYNILNSAVIELFDFIRTEDIKTLMNHVVETYYPYLDSINYVKTFRDLKLRYEQHKERYSDQFSRSRLSNEDSTPSLYRSRGMISDRFRVDYDKNDEDAWIEEDEEEQQIHQRQSSSEGYLSINGGLGPTATQTNGDGLGMGDHASNTATDSSSSSSSSSSSNGGGDLNQPVADSSEFIDYKRHHLLHHHHHRHGDEDEEESEETLFAPVKSTVVSSSTQQQTTTATTTNHHHNGGSSIKTSTISIKINTTSLRSLATTTSNHVGEHNEAESSLSPGGANNSTSSLSPSSNPSTPSSALSPLCTKKALVDYEYDSDEEEEKEEVGEEEENEEKNKNQPSIESKTEKVDEQEEQEEEKEENEEKEERPESSTTKSPSIDEAKINNKTAPIIDTSPPQIESSSSNKVIEEASSSSSLSPHRENIDSPEINGQIEPANKRARLSST